MERNPTANLTRGLDFRLVPGHFWAAAVASGSVTQAWKKKGEISRGMILTRHTTSSGNLVEAHGNV